MIYMFLSNNPSSGDINSSNLSCLVLVLLAGYTVQLSISVCAILVSREF